MTSFKPQLWNGVPIPYDGSVADLRAMAAEPGPKAWAAIRALAETPDAEALAALVQLARSPDPHLRRSAIEAIGLHPSGRTASKAVWQALHDRDGFTVRTAAEAAARLGLGRAHERVVSLVRAADEATRLAALRALGALWQSSDFE
jgi:HEAT repeat protein